MVVSETARTIYCKSYTDRTTSFLSISKSIAASMLRFPRTSSRRGCDGRRPSCSRWGTVTSRSRRSMRSMIIWRDPVRGWGIAMSMEDNQHRYNTMRLSRWIVYSPKSMRKLLDKDGRQLTQSDRFKLSKGLIACSLNASLRVREGNTFSYVVGSTRPSKDISIKSTNNNQESRYSIFIWGCIYRASSCSIITSLISSSTISWIRWGINSNRHLRLRVRPLGQ